MQEHYESQDRFSDYLRYVKESRRMNNLEGNADIRLDHTQQSGLDDWMECQHFQLDNCESLEEPLKRANEGLDAAKKEVYETGDSKFGYAFREIRSDSLNTPIPLKTRIVSSHEPDQWFGHELKLEKPE